MRTLTVLFLVIAVGCSSTRSILVHRGECDQDWETERHLKGVPITLQVPTHIRVDVTEHHFLGYDGPQDTDGVRKIVWLDHERVGVPIRTVSTELVKTAKIFTVDPKRPAAGTLNATMDFGGEHGQYLDKLTYSVDDQTIEAITGLLRQVATKGLIGSPTTDSGRSASVDAEMKRVDSVVASAFFSLDAPDVELQIAQFLDTHLNGCHTCRVVEPGVVTPTRVPPLHEESCQHGVMLHECPVCPPMLP